MFVPWFPVDKEGLRKTQEGQHKSFVIRELLQNAWDQDVKEVTVELTGSDTRGYSTIIVEDDDPNGFADIAHAYTFFAESEKKNDPEKRGRFNIGEKLTLSLCKNAEIETVGRTVTFSEKSGRRTKKNNRKIGSRFYGTIKINKEEREDILRKVHHLIPPTSVTTVVNGDTLRHREPLTTFSCSMPTIIANEEGIPVKTKRVTEIEVYRTLYNEKPFIYEMGIPVVELEDDKFHINVQQKVPVSKDRDNVPPSYKKRLRAMVMNNSNKFMSEEDCQSNWVQEATSHPESTSEAVNKMLDAKFTKNRVMNDPTDPEASHTAVANGYTVIYGRTLSKENHKQARDVAPIVSASTLFPTKNTSGSEMEIRFDPTENTERVVKLSIVLAQRILNNNDLNVYVINNPEGSQYADWNRTKNVLRFNAGTLGVSWFDPSNLQDILDLIIHEFGHHYESNHLSENYYKALSMIGSKVAMLALQEPEIFDMMK